MMIKNNNLNSDAGDPDIWDTMNHAFQYGVEETGEYPLPFHNHPWKHI